MASAAKPTKAEQKETPGEVEPLGEQEDNEPKAEQPNGEEQEGESEEEQRSSEELLASILKELQASNKQLKELFELQKKILKRTDTLGELTVTRLNWMEWRELLKFESDWSKTSLQAAYKLWKLGAMSSPSREGDDRDGLPGSPWLTQDEEQADKDMPDELVWQRLADHPKRLWPSLVGDLDKKKSERAKQLLERKKKNVEFELRQQGAASSSS